MWRWFGRRAQPPVGQPTGLLEDATGTLTARQHAQIKGIELRMRQLASSSLGGGYRSIFRGSGIEFAEAREYAPGDELRMVDWNATARMGRPWVKRFVEEREGALVCAVDVSASQLVGQYGLGRIGAAAELTALLGFAAVEHRDRVGLLTFAGRVERFVPPGRGTRHARRLVRDVLHHARSTEGTDIAQAAEYLSRALTRRSLVFLVSDFFDDGYSDALRALSRRHQVIALVLVDPIDLELPAGGLVSFRLAEGGSTALVDTGSEEVRRRYAEEANSRVARRHEQLEAAAVAEIEIRLDRDLVAPIAHYFHSVARRR